MIFFKILGLVSCQYTAITVTSTSTNTVVETVLDDTGICNEITLKTGTATILVNENTQEMILGNIYTVDVK
ncbi:MAG: hypothetical protein U9N02_05700 [Campylobacterota bacterium]|nr:hypothetical protein [Campylobacterota bacterium]